MSGPSLHEINQVLLAGGADRHDRPVVEQNSHLFDIVDRLAAQQGMGAAGVIPDHSADRAAIMRGRIRREDELVVPQLLLECIQHDSRLHPGILLLGIDLYDLVHVLGKVENDRHVAALSRQTCASSTGQDRSAIPSADRHRCNHVVGIARDHEADGDLAVVRAVGRIHGAASAIEADFSSNFTFQLSL